MKAIVFDNAGTILKRVTALNDLTNEKIIFETNTIGMVNKNQDTLLLVFQTPTKKLIQNNCKIIDYLKKNRESFEISYSRKSYTKDEVIQALENDTTMMSQIRVSAKALIEKYDLEICSGSAMIVNIKQQKIEYVYTAGGLFFTGTPNLFKRLNEMPLSIYIASGDNKQSLNRIATILNIDKSNIYHTCNVGCKRKVVEKLQTKYEKVIMVGNQANDLLAIRQSDIGILSIQQKEELPDELLSSADYIIDNIKQVLKIVEDEV